MILSVGWGSPLNRRGERSLRLDSFLPDILRQSDRVSQASISMAFPPWQSEPFLHSMTSIRCFATATKELMQKTDPEAEESFHPAFQLFMWKGLEPQLAKNRRSMNSGEWAILVGVWEPGFSEGNKEKLDTNASLIPKQKAHFHWDNRKACQKARLHSPKVPIYIFTKKKACSKKAE